MTPQQRSPNSEALVIFYLSIYNSPVSKNPKKFLPESKIKGNIKIDKKYSRTVTIPLLNQYKPMITIRFVINNVIVIFVGSSFSYGSETANILSTF